VRAPSGTSSAAQPPDPRQPPIEFLKKSPVLYFLSASKLEGRGSEKTHGANCAFSDHREPEVDNP